MAVKIKIMLDDGASMPTRATDGSVGYDVRSTALYVVDGDGDKLKCYTEDDLYNLVECGHQANYIEVHTGVHVQPEDGYHVELFPNSRIGKLKVIYGNSIGLIDPDYTGGIRVILNNTDDAWHVSEVIKFLPSNVVGQLVIRKKYDAEWELTNKLDETVRGDGGFGSTEKK